jgi:hypothetical protein
MPKAPANSKRLLRLKDASAYMSLSTWQLRRIVQAGEIPLVRIGSEGAPWLVDVRDLDQFIDQHKEKIE